MNDVNLTIPRSLLRGNLIPSPLEGEGRVRGMRASIRRYPTACCRDVHYPLRVSPDKIATRASFSSGVAIIIMLMPASMIVSG